MKPGRATVVLMLATFALPAPAQPSNACEQQLESVTQLLEQGRRDEAEQLLVDLVSSARETTDKDCLAPGLVVLGAVRRGKGEYVQSEELLLESIEVIEAQKGEKHADLMPPLQILGKLYVDLERWGEAESVFGRILGLQQWGMLGEENVDVVATLNDLGEKHVDVVDTLSDLGQIYRHLARYEEAERMGKRALAMGERTLQPDSLKLAVLLSNLGLIYWSQNRVDEALPLYQRALRIQESSLGPDHPDVASTLRALSNINTLYEATVQTRTEMLLVLYVLVQPVLFPIALVRFGLFFAKQEKKPKLSGVLIAVGTSALVVGLFVTSSFVGSVVMAILMGYAGWYVAGFKNRPAVLWTILCLIFFVPALLILLYLPVAKS